MSTEPWSAHLSDGLPFTTDSLAQGATLPAKWAARWSSAPTVPTLVAAGSASPLSGAELEQRTRSVAHGLAASGVKPGDRVLWVGGASLDAVCGALAVLRLGAALVPVNATYTEREFTHVARDVDPSAAIVARPEQGEWVGRATDGAVVVLSGERTTTREHDGEAVALDAARPGDPTLIVFTSGTTGAPKGAVLSHANLVAGLASLERAWGWESDDRLVSALPLFHVHGLCVALFGSLAAGASIVLLDRFDAAAVLDAAKENKATMFFGVPTMYHRLLERPRVSELSGLRLCVSGSAPLPASAWARMDEQAGVQVLERYGTSETLLTISNPLHGERRPGTVGFPLPGVDVRLEAHGDEGSAHELWVRGPTVFTGYWGRPAETAACFEDGWFQTADLAEVDPDGYYIIKGRRSELIITGGYNVYPAEVEDVLLRHRSVAEVAVGSMPSEEWGEEVVAWVVLADGVGDAALLSSFAAEQLAPYKRPRRYVFIDSLPRTPTGKVIRSELR